MRSSRLPGIKTLDDFDFSFQPSIKQRADRQPPRSSASWSVRRTSSFSALRASARRISRSASPSPRLKADAESTTALWPTSSRSLEEAKPPASWDAASRSSPDPSLLVIDEIRLPARSARPAPCSSSNSSTGAMSAHPPSSRPTKGSRSGVRWMGRRGHGRCTHAIASCITAISSTYAAAATGCGSTPTSPRSSTRLLRSRAPHPLEESPGKSKGENDHLEARHLRRV